MFPVSYSVLYIVYIVFFIVFFLVLHQYDELCLKLFCCVCQLLRLCCMATCILMTQSVKQRLSAFHLSEGILVAIGLFFPQLKLVPVRLSEHVINV